ncbi:response regulator [Cohnella terricola]|uniref:response regulator n=1 Tax=Cohnella terricola TaxID=1289167 RepID=UPI001FEAE08E|nr:response regulator [Cohnella terricola]
MDDEIHVVERLATLVPWEQAGITCVHKAISAEEAIEKMHESPIHIVITDIRMPGMTGLELSALIAKQWKKTKCIILSGHADFQYAKEAFLNGAVGYLLKPVTDEELLSTVSEAVSTLNTEWEQVISQERIERTLRENSLQLRANLLSELIQGRRYSRSELQDKMTMMQVPDFYDKPFWSMLVRLEEPFYTYNPHNLALIEYAIGNMAEELFAPHFELWHSKDTYDYLVFLVKPKEASLSSPIIEEEILHTLERSASLLQTAIHTYLKGFATILVSQKGLFPADLSTLYYYTLSTLRKNVGAEQDLILTYAGESLENKAIRSIPALYELPTLAQFLEAGQWDSAQQRLERIASELKEKRDELQEQLLEVFLSIASAFTYFAHKNGRLLAELIGPNYDKLIEGTPHRSIQQLTDWSLEVLNHLRMDNEDAVKDSRTKLIAEVQQFVERELSNDVSLLAIAVHVFMHPVYISKIYKLETGENLSDYVHRVRMEKAARLLLNSQVKIYEIAAQIGYQRAHSFINVFKKHTGATPQEYRDKFGTS